MNAERYNDPTAEMAIANVMREKKRKKKKEDMVIKSKGEIMPRNKSCQYCGKIHMSNYDCGKKPKKKLKYIRPESDAFRNTSRWQKKREEIKERDNYLCQICIRNIYNTQKIINHENIEVHHCNKLRDDYDNRLENSNLLTVCEYHHKRCDDGTIPVQIVQSIIYEQENTPLGGENTGL